MLQIELRRSADAFLKSDTLVLPIRNATVEEFSATCCRACDPVGR